MNDNYKKMFLSRTFPVKIVIFLNLIISLYYSYLFFGSFFVFDDLPLLNTIRNGISFLGVVLGAYYLVKGKGVGKILTKFVGILGVIYMIGYGLYGFSLIGQPGYGTVVVINYTINYITNIFIRHIYPLIAGFIILGKSNEELGLE